MPQRAHQPSADERRLVERAASIGVQQNVIAEIVGISEPTLRRHYRAELDHAGIKANVAVADRLYQTAIGDGPRAVTAQIFWLKCRGGWKDDAPAQQDPHEIAIKIQACIAEMNRVSSGAAYDAEIAAKE